MTKFESSVKQIPYPVEDVYRNISDLNNLERVRDRIPEDKLNSFSFDSDSVSVNVAPVGDLKLMKVTVQADIPFMLKGMVAGPLQDGVEKIADALSKIPFV